MNLNIYNLHIDKRYYISDLKNMYFQTDIRESIAVHIRYIKELKIG